MRIDELPELDAAGHRAIDPLQLMQRAADQVFATIGNADGVLLGLTVDAKSLRFVCGAGYLLAHVGERLELEGSLCGRALASGTALLSGDTELDPRVNRDATRSFAVRSSVCVPLSQGDDPLGVLCVSSSRPHAFDDRDIALLDSMAGLLAAVIATACDFGPKPASAAELAEPCGDIVRIVSERDYNVVLQPIFALRGGELFGAEALVRFPTLPAGGPEACLARAHEAGLGVELELAIIETALSSLPRLREHALLTLNAGPHAIACTRLREILHVADSNRLVVELTEQVAVADYPQLRAALQHLRDAGVRLAVDDAGSGFASLIHILKLAPDIIKLDRELTANVHIDPMRRSLASSLRRFAHESGAVVVAEGIETAAELKVLSALDIDHGQGFHLARPVALDAFDDAVEAGSMRIREHQLQVAAAA